MNTPTNEHSQPPGVFPRVFWGRHSGNHPRSDTLSQGRSTMDSCQVPRHYFFFHHRFPFFTCAMLPKPRVLQHRGRHANVMIIEEESGDPTGVNFEHADETYLASFGFGQGRFCNCYAQLVPFCQRSEALRLRKKDAIRRSIDTLGC